MRVLGLETSTRRGSAALVEDGRLVAHGSHEQPNAHAERLLPLVSQLMRESGWSPATLDRLAVGIGPGSFTGVRVGMALVQGLALGLAVPVVGIPSLVAMAMAIPPSIPGRRVACLDARRGALFVSVHSPATPTACEPLLVPRERFLPLLTDLHRAGALVVVGEVAAELGLDPTTQPGSSVALAGGQGPGPWRYVAADADLPDARWVAELALTTEPAPAGLQPLYVREPDALLPAEPPDALARQLTLDPVTGDGPQSPDHPERSGGA